MILKLCSSFSLEQKARIVLGVIGHDIHVVANRVLETLLQSQGFVICNLGTNNTSERFADAALEMDADAVMVSTLNGEGEYWCKDFRPLFVERGLPDIILYVGGNLGIGVENDPCQLVDRYQGWGFNRVFAGITDFNSLAMLLEQDTARPRCGNRT